MNAGLSLAVALLAASLAVAEVPLSRCEDPGEWDGKVSFDATRAHEGQGCLRWAYADAPVITLKATPADWSGANAMSLWIYTEKVLEHRPWIIVERREPAGDAGMSYAIPWHDFSGWTHFVIPFGEMAHRGPARWDNIASLKLDSTRRAGVRPPPDPTTVLYLDDIRLVTIETPGPGKGPRLSDAEFFAALDLQRPDLAAVKTAVARGDMRAARAAFAAHIRARRSPRWFPTWLEEPAQPNKDYALAQADAVLKSDYRFGNVTHHFAGRVDWSYNPEQFREGPLATIEYNALLNRFYHLGFLQTAWLHTHDEKYVDRMFSDIVSWVEDCPLLLFKSGNGDYHYAWETLNAAARLSYWWPHVIYSFRDHPACTDDAIVTIWKSLYEHVQHLLKWPSTNNWLTSESKAVYFTGLMNPEFRDAAAWRRVGAGRLYGQLDQDVYPDGVQCELALGYNVSVLRSFTDVLDLAQLNKQLDTLPPDYLQRIEKMYSYLLYGARPDLRIPGGNDSDHTVDIRESMQAAARLFPQRADFRWAATERIEGKAPAPNSTAFPYAGQYFMRTGWSTERDLHLRFDAGPWGAAHQHEDKLNLVMYAYGRPLLVEAATHQYDKSEERRYVLSTRGHNTVRVDGRDQANRYVPESWKRPQPFQPLDNSWFSGPVCDFAEGSYGLGYGSDKGWNGGSWGWGNPKDVIRVAHTRSLLFVKPKYWIVTDVLRPADEASHRYESLFHLEGKQAEATGLVVSTVEPGPNVQLVACGPESLKLKVVQGQTEPELQGWVEGNFTNLRPVPTAVYEWEGAGVCRVTTVIYPTPAGERSPVTAVKQLPVTGPDGKAVAATAVEISFADGSRDVYLKADPGAGQCRFGGYESTATCALVRTGPDGKTSATWQAEATVGFRPRLRTTGPSGRTTDGRQRTAARRPYAPEGG